MDPPMVTDVGVFQVADVPMYGYVYTLPLKYLLNFKNIYYLVFSSKLSYNLFIVLQS